MSLCLFFNSASSCSASLESKVHGAIVVCYFKFSIATSLVDGDIFNLLFPFRLILLFVAGEIQGLARRIGAIEAVVAIMRTHAANAGVSEQA